METLLAQLELFPNLVLGSKRGTTLYRYLILQLFTTLDERVTAIEDGTVDITEVVVGAGTAAAPSITTTDDEDTGLYFPAANQVAYSAGGTGQVIFKDGVLEPVTDDDVDLGASSKEFKDLYIDGTANIDSLVADTADINGGTVDGATIGASSASSGKFTTLETTGLSTMSARTTLTALAGGAQAGTALTTEYNDFTVVATAADSAQLPVAVLGKRVIVRNSAAKAMAVFGQTGDSIDGGSANASVSIGPGQTVTFEGISATTWKTFQGITGAVSQGTNITTGVTINALKGLITTQSASAGAAGATPNTFTVTNSFCTATSNVRAYIVDYAGTIATNGNPFVIVDNRTSTGFDIIISNAHGTNAVSGVLVIGFDIVS